MNNESKICGEPTNFIINRLPSYNETAATVLTNTKYIPVTPISSDTFNIFICFLYNFIRPYGPLNNYTPAEVADFASDSSAKTS